jgi:hypothetical protein
MSVTTMQVFEPTAELGVALSEASEVSVNGSLRGKTVVILDNGWSSYEIAAPVLKEELTRRFGVEQVLEFRKSMIEPAPQEAYDAGITQASLVLAWLGNCGGCTSWSVHDAAEFTKHGRAAVSFVTANFVGLADIVARGKGVAGLPIIALPADFEQSRHEDMRESVRLSLDVLATELKITDILAADAADGSTATDRSAPAGGAFADAL